MSASKGLCRFLAHAISLFLIRFVGMHPSPSRSRGQNRNILIAGGLVFIVVFMISLAIFSPRSSSSTGVVPGLNPNGEVAYLEPIETNPTRAAMAMCLELEAYNQSAAHRAHVSDVAMANKHPFTADMILAKLKIWDGPSAKKGPSVMCMTLGHGDRNGEGEWTQRLWARKCDQHFLYTDAKSVPDISPAHLVTIEPLGGNKEGNGWQRLRSALKHGTQFADQYQFFMVTGDQSMVFVENLRKMLDEPQIRWFTNMGTPMVIGHRMTSGSGVQFVSGAGFVINQPAMKMLAYAIDAEVCKPKLENAALDLSLAECLREFGVFFSDSTDEVGEDRIHVFNPDLLVQILSNPKSTQWYIDYHHRELPKGLDSLGRYTVLFHYITPSLAHSLYERIYK